MTHDSENFIRAMHLKCSNLKKKQRFPVECATEYSSRVGLCLIIESLDNKEITIKW